VVCNVDAAASDIDTALALEKQGRLEAAHQLLISAATKYRSASDRANLARALGIAADVSISLGIYDAAIAEMSDAIRVRLDLRDTRRIADDYNTLGLAYQYKGDFRQARGNYSLAVDADRAAGDREDEITHLNNIGNTDYFEGKYSEALRFYEQAMDRVQGTNESWTASRRDLTLANLATLYQRLGQEPRALDLYRQLAGASRALPAREQAQMLINQGVLFRRLGDPVKALELYRAAQELFARDRHRDGEIGALRNIGIVLTMDFGDLRRALDSFTRALNLARESSNRRAVAQSALYRSEVLKRLNRLADARADLELARDIGQQVGLPEEQWKALYGLGEYRKSIEIIESLRSGLRLAPMRSDFLADKRDVYDALIASRLRDPNVTPAELFDLMERSRARTLLDRMAVHRGLETLTLANVQSRLADRALIEYWTAGPQTAALWITKSEAHIVRIAPGASVLDGVPLGDHLVIIPDGALALTPFESIRLPDGKFLIERADVTYLPSAQFLRDAHARQKYQGLPKLDLIALADPPAADKFGEQVPPLPQSASEIRDIADVLHGRSRLYFREQAMKRYVQSAAAPVLHLATHAFVDPENPDRSRILLGDGYLYQEEVYDLDLSQVDLVTLSACDTARGKLSGGEAVQAFSQAFLAAGAKSTVTTLWRVGDRTTAEFMKLFYSGLARGKTKAEALRVAKLAFLHSGTEFADPKYWAAFILTGEGSDPVPLSAPFGATLWLIAWILILIMAALWWRERALRSAAPGRPGNRKSESVDPR
jgi:tetratricopeptide (TPR) repeat protein